MMKKFIDFYKILNIPANADKSEIKKAFKELAKQYHPDNLDKNVSSEEYEKSVNTFKRINKIYQILMDDEKRKKYDQKYQQYMSQQETSKKAVIIDLQDWKEGNKRPRTGTIDNLYSRVMHSNNNKMDEYEGYQDIKDQAEIEKEEPNSTLSKLAISKEAQPTFLSSLRLKHQKIMRGALLAGAIIAVGITSLKVKAAIEEWAESQLAEETVDNYVPTTTIIRNYQVHLSDTLSQLAEDANCSQTEIKLDNNRTDDSLYFNEIIEIPYHIPTDELYKYTTTNLYQGENIEDYAATYETTVDSLIKLNKEEIIETNGRYIVLSDTLITPTFSPYESTKVSQK